MKADWIWMPHPGHLCVSSECRFHLNTKVGNYIVSTVGEYLPDSEVREILARSRGVSLTGRGDYRRVSWLKQVGYEEIGLGRKYETMVFEATPSEDECCPWKQASGMEIDSDGYNNAGDAYRGHIAMCEKWDRNEALERDGGGGE